MPRRSYRQYCGLARSLDVLGERWTLLIVRNLLLGPQRYSDLLRGLPGITTNLLAKRLKEMEAHDLISHDATDAAAATYRLTEDGRALEPAIHALGRWGWQHAGKPRVGDQRSLDWLLVALRRRYRGGATLTATIDADGAPYHIVLRGDVAEIGRGAAPASDVRLTGQGTAIARMFLEETPRGAVPGVEVEGESRALRTLLGAFHRGDPAAA
jgi:DNA-binding HxlR family transcriptional regulator